VKAEADLLVLNAKQLLTLQGKSRKPAVHHEMKDLRIIRNGGLAIKNGRIIAVRKTSKIKQNFQSSTILDAKGKVVMPGLVDAHTHLVFAGSREIEFEMRIEGASYIEILKKGGGILRTVMETRKASVETLVEMGIKTLNTMLKHGTTTVEAKSGYGLSTEHEVKILEVIKRLSKKHPMNLVPTFMGAHAFPPEYAENPESYIRLITEEMIPIVTERNLAQFCDVFCEQGVFSISQSKRILETAKGYGLKLKVHADELSCLGGAELAAEVNAVSAEHLIYTSEAGIEALARAGVVAVLLPAASFALMINRYAEARKMIAKGVPIALGTDFNPSCWTENMQLVIALACRNMRLSPAEAITSATINAAHALNRANDIGSLEVGKRADIIVLDVPDYRFLSYRFGVNLIDSVIKDGRVVVERGILSCIEG
jgi:imidazolonepropionase